MERDASMYKEGTSILPIKKQQGANSFTGLQQMIRLSIAHL